MIRKNITLDEETVSLLEGVSDNISEAIRILSKRIQVKELEYDKNVVDLIRNMRPALRADSLVINAALHNFANFLMRYPNAATPIPQAPVPEIDMDTPLSQGTTPTGDISYEQEVQ